MEGVTEDAIVTEEGGVVVVLIRTEPWKFVVNSLASAAIVRSANVATLTLRRTLKSTMDV